MYVLYIYNCIIYSTTYTYTYIQYIMYVYLPIYSTYIYNICISFKRNGTGYSFFVLGSRRHGMLISHIMLFSPVALSPQIEDLCVGLDFDQEEQRVTDCLSSNSSRSYFKAHLSTKDNESERSNKNAQKYLNENSEEANISKSRQNKGTLIILEGSYFSSSSLIFEVYGHVSSCFPICRYPQPMGFMAMVALPLPEGIMAQPCGALSEPTIYESMINLLS